MIFHRDFRQGLDNRIEISGVYIAEIGAGNAVVTWKHPFGIDCQMDKRIVLQVRQERVYLVHNRCPPKIKIQKEDQIVLLAEIDIRLDSCGVQMMAIEALWTRKAVRYTSHQINARLDRMGWIDLVISRRLSL